MYKYGAYIDTRDFIGRTPLFLAVRFNFPDGAKFLIACGANPWLKTYGGQSMHSVARQRSMIPILKAARIIRYMSKYYKILGDLNALNKDSLTYINNIVMLREMKNPNLIASLNKNLN